MTPKFELWRYLCTVYLTAKFLHPTFNRSEVIVLTNKQTPLKTFTSLRYATPVSNHSRDASTLEDGTWVVAMNG